MTRFLASAALAVISLTAATPALAQAEIDGTPFQVSIPVGDLDLATPAGQQRFMDRARAAATAACGTPAPFRAAEEAVAMRCRQGFVAAAKAGRDQRVRGLTQLSAR